MGDTLLDKRRVEQNIQADIRPKDEADQPLYYKPKLFDEYFQIAQNALEAGNDEILKDVLQSILAVYGSELTSGSENIKQLLDFRQTDEVV